MDADEYDFEAILETLMPLYASEGSAAVVELLTDNGFPAAVIATITAVLADLHDRPDATYFDG